MNSVAGFARAAFRGITYPGIALRSFAEYEIIPKAAPQQVAWLQRVAARHARWIGLDIRVTGQVPQSGIIVGNHISYLDIVALSAVGQFAFVAKKEVAGWPLFGRFARCGGTIFVDRERRGAVAEVARQMGDHLAQGVPVVLFPEGTSTDGTHVLPFRSSLLEPAVDFQVPVTPCGLRYAMTEGNVREEVAYWGEMTLAPHLLNLLRKRRVTVHLAFGEPLVSIPERKSLARVLHQEVCRLAELAETGTRQGNVQREPSNRDALGTPVPA
jgi:lyso-ornithine lipid O-acyltransferase